MNKPCLFRVVTNEHDQLLQNWYTLSETDRGILNPRLPVLAFVLFSFGSERLHWKLKARDPCWLWSFHGYIININIWAISHFHDSWKTFQVIHHKDSVNYIFDFLLAKQIAGPTCRLHPQLQETSPNSSNRPRVTVKWFFPHSKGPFHLFLHEAKIGWRRNVEPMRLGWLFFLKWNHIFL